MSLYSVLQLNSCDIRFENRGGVVWVCLTDIARACGKHIGHWNDLKSTKEFLTALELETNQVVIKANISGERRLVGTWGIKEVADRFYQWCFNSPKKDTKNQKGFVYILVDNANNAFKIGFTTNLESRLETHKTSNPFLELVKVYNVSSIDVETSIHYKLTHYRIAGTNEWYQKCPKVLNIVDLVCSSNK